MDVGVEREFRDGVRMIPRHIDEYMTGIDILHYTYREALEAANKARVSEHLNNLQKKVISEHFKDIRSF
jgi:hypothetical protein